MTEQETNLDPDPLNGQDQMAKETKMISHALINITEILERLEEGGLKGVLEELREMHSKECRPMILSEKEILDGTSLLMKEAAATEDELTDKMLRIFWGHADASLKRTGILH